jgi:P-type conjugative transfer protein TrbJ
MKRFVLSLGSTFVLLSLLVSPALAFPVTCTNCSTEWTAIMDQITNLEELANAINQYQESMEQTRQQMALVQNNIQQYENMVQQYENMLQNTKNLPQNILGQMTGKFSELAKLTNKLNLQKGDYMAMGQVFDEMYPGLDIVKGLAGGDSNKTVPEVWEEWSGEVDRAAQATFQVTASQLRDMAENSDLLDQQISKVLSTPEGQMQAIQSGNALAALQIDEMRQMRMLMATNIQMTTQMAMKDEKRGQLSKEQVDLLLDYNALKEYK